MLKANAINIITGSIRFWKRHASQYHALFPYVYQVDVQPNVTSFFYEILPTRNVNFYLTDVVIYSDTVNRLDPFSIDKFKSDAYFPRLEIGINHTVRMSLLADPLIVKRHQNVLSDTLANGGNATTVAVRIPNHDPSGFVARGGEDRIVIRATNPVDPNVRTSKIVAVQLWGIWAFKSPDPAAHGAYLYGKDVAGDGNVLYPHGAIPISEGEWASYTASVTGNFEAEDDLIIWAFNVESPKLEGRTDGGLTLGVSGNIISNRPIAPWPGYWDASSYNGYRNATNTTHTLVNPFTQASSYWKLPVPLLARYRDVVNVSAVDPAGTYTVTLHMLRRIEK